MGTIKNICYIIACLSMSILVSSCCETRYILSVYNQTGNDICVLTYGGPVLRFDTAYIDEEIVALTEDSVAFYSNGQFSHGGSGFISQDSSRNIVYGGIFLRGIFKNRKTWEYIVYFIDPDVAGNKSWNTIETEKLYESVTTYSYKELKKKNWQIVYPNRN